MCLSERRLFQVQTEEQAATQGGADKDPKSLSGGEKSYSTICLLLSLWEAIGCPIRCLGTLISFYPSFPSRLLLALDEFDVFMDAVNRRISMKKMVSFSHSLKTLWSLMTCEDRYRKYVGWQAVHPDHTARHEPRRDRPDRSYSSYGRS